MKHTGEYKIYPHTRPSAYIKHSSAAAEERDRKPICWFENWPRYTEGKERPKNEADHARWVGGKFSQRENLLMRLVVSSCKTSRSPHLPARILKVYIDVLNGFSHIFSPDGLSNTLLSQGYMLGRALAMGMVGGMYMPRTGKGVRSFLMVQVQLRVSQRSHTLDDLLQQRDFYLHICGI